MGATGSSEGRKELLNHERTLKMKRIMALTAATSILALFMLASQASANGAPLMTSDPAYVPAEGEYTFTVSGTGFTPGLALFVLPCTVPGAPMTPDNAEEAIAGMGQDNCNLGSLTPAVVGDDGTFSVEITTEVGQNFVWGAGDAAGTESAGTPVFIGDMTDDMAPEGAAETGFGGMAGSGRDGGSVPLAATLAAVVLLGGTALVTRASRLRVSAD